MTVILRGLREIESMDILTRSSSPRLHFRWMVLWHCKGRKRMAFVARSVHDILSHSRLCCIRIGN